jgi:hypothetical protein
MTGARMTLVPETTNEGTRERRPLCIALACFEMSRQYRCFFVD